ncbi:uncharacterized protein DEA37_0014953 [Paragonimus westermani]|uniref:C2H2-type domain-containing protein n=1 Tax=Paragonimus westermani TaxID=34504 RepID=A0A5J4NEW0_9TREM|nr:uncharacterized protein DEA37_0014953 [Paragonimus westermani]
MINLVSHRAGLNASAYLIVHSAPGHSVVDCQVGGASFRTLGRIPQRGGEEHLDTMLEYGQGQHWVDGGQHEQPDEPSRNEIGQTDEEWQAENPPIEGTGHTLISPLDPASLFQSVIDRLFSVEDCSTDSRPRLLWAGYFCLPDLSTVDNTVPGAVGTRFTNQEGFYLCPGLDSAYDLDSIAITGFADRRQHKEFYDSLKAIFGPSIQSTKALVDVDTGYSCSQPEVIMGIWRKHFGSLLNHSTTIEWATVNSLPQQDGKSSLALDPDLLELQRAIGQLRNGKAAGEDGLPGKGSEQCTDSYRGISLLSCAGKVLARIPLNRLDANVLKVNVPEEQCGFRSSWSTIDMVFAAQQLHEKCPKMNQPLYALFVDFTKTSDSVSREALWMVLGKFGCLGKFVSTIGSLHLGMKAKVQSCGSTSDEFDIFTGVKQGCVLAPALFSLYLTAIVTAAFQDSGENGVEVEYRLTGACCIFDASVPQPDYMPQRYISPCSQMTALLAHNEEELQRLATAFGSAASKFGLDINTGKTFSFFQPSPGGGAACVPPPEIRIAGDTVNGCGDFCYLGSNLSTDLSVDRELRARVAKASAAFGRLERRVWKNHSLKMATKLCVYRSMVLSILLYGSETWTLYQRNVSYLSRFHVQCLRRILGIRWSDMIPNTEVLRRADMDGMEAMLMLNQLRWLGHVRRMGDDRIPKQLLYGQVKSGKRNPGGQKRRYQDVVQVSLSRCNIDFRCWEDLALNRTAWRNTVRAGVRAFNEQLLRGRERKRAVRKGTIGAIGRGDVTIWRCDVCGRECAGRLGLVGHQRTHSTPSAKSELGSGRPYQYIHSTSVNDRIGQHPGR